MKKIIIALFLIFIAASAYGDGATSYTQNTSPAMTDEMLGIDDPAGSWTINRFPLQNLSNLILGGTEAGSFTGVTIGGNDALDDGDIGVTVAADSVITDILGSDLNTQAKLRAAAVKIIQPVTTADSGDGNPAAETVTPTAGYGEVSVQLTCSDSDGCTLAFGETGAADGVKVTVLNEGANPYTATYSAGNFDTGCGTGSTMAINSNQSFEMEYSTAGSAWIVTSNQSGNACFTSIDMTGGTLIADDTTIKPGFNTDTSGGITLVVNEVNYGTDTGDADIPDDACDAAADVGNWVVLISSAADAYSLTSNDASNQFTLSDNASAWTAGNEVDVDGTQISVVCIAAELWKITGYMGTAPTDGGAAD